MYSRNFLARKSNNKHGKISLPVVVLAEIINITEKNMFFKISNESKTKHVYASVIDFNDETEFCGIPQNLMNDMNIEEEDLVIVELVNLEKGSFIKFKASNDFLSLSNPKSILEHNLSNYSLLYLNQKINIFYLEKEYIIYVEELRPNLVIDIIDTDIEIEFVKELEFFDDNRKINKLEFFDDNRKIDKLEFFDDNRKINKLEFFDDNGKIEVDKEIKNKKIIPFQGEGRIARRR